MERFPYGCAQRAISRGKPGVLVRFSLRGVKPVFHLQQDSATTTVFAGKPAKTDCQAPNHLPDQKKRHPKGWRFHEPLKAQGLTALHSGLRRPKPGRWPEPAGAPRRLPEGASRSTRTMPGRFFGAGLAGRLVSTGRSATGVPRLESPRPAGAPRPSPRSVRPLAGRGVRGPRSPS